MRKIKNCDMFAHIAVSGRSPSAAPAKGVLDQSEFPMWETERPGQRIGALRQSHRPRRALQRGSAARDNSLAAHCCSFYFCSAPFSKTVSAGPLLQRVRPLPSVCPPAPPAGKPSVHRHPKQAMGRIPTCRRSARAVCRRIQARCFACTLKSRLIHEL